MTSAAAPARTNLLAAAALRTVIDFFEEIVVLPDHQVLRIQLQRFLVCLLRVVELPLVLVGDREIVPRGRVRRIELHRLLPAIERFVPETVLRDLDAELD